MPLPKFVLQQFTHLLAEPLAWALRRFRFIALTPERAEEEWRAVWEASDPKRRQALADVLRRLRAEPGSAERLLGRSLDPSLVESWWAVAGQEASRLRAEVKQEPEITEALTGLRGRYIAAFSVAEPVPAFRELLAPAEKLQERAVHPASVREIVEFQCEVRYQLGRRLAEEQRREEALEQLRSGLSLAEEQGLELQADEARLAMADIHYKGAASIDAALRRMLPLWQAAREHEPSLPIARFAVLLAHIYAQARDRYECRRYVERATALLEKIDLGFPPGQSFADALQDWLAAAGSQAQKPNDIRQTVYEAISLHTQLAKLHTDILPEGPQSAPWYERVQALAAATEELHKADNAQYREDVALLARFTDAEAEVDPATASANFFQEEVLDLGRRIDAYRRRLDEEGPGEELLAGLRADLAKIKNPALSRLGIPLHWLLGEALAESEETAEAMTHFHQAFELSMADNHLDNALYSLQCQLVYYAPDQHRERLAVCRRAIGLIERARREISTSYQQSAFLEDKQAFYQLGMIAAYKLGEYEEMLRIGELIKSRNLLTGMAAGSREESRREAMKAKLETIARRLREAPEPERTGLQRERQLLWDQWTVEQNRAAENEALPGFSLSALQATLGEGEAVLSYHVLDQSVLLIGAIDRADVIFTRQIAEDAEWGTQLEGLFAVAAGPGAFRARTFESEQRGLQMREPAAQQKWTADELAAFLIPETIRPVLTGKNRLYIAPHRQLHEAPLHALPFEGGYLIERFAVSYLPNLSCRLFLLPKPAADGLLIAGSDTYAPVGERLLPNLPGAAAEVAELEQLYIRRGSPVLALLNTEAARARLLALDDDNELARFRILHLALHGEDVPGDSPLDARLFLQDAPVDGFDISLWRLRAELVVLSCCYAGSRPTSGRGLDYLPGDDLFGLQAGFFAAGARSVLGALRPVDDRSGKELMIRFHQYLGDQEPARALQSATRDYLAEAPAQRRHPAYWAPFFLAEL